VFVVRPRLKHFSILLIIVPLFLGELYVGHWLFQMWKLQTSSSFQTTMADVTTYGKWGNKWGIKYHFQVAGDSTIYGAQSINYRDTWMPITDQAYEEIQRHDGKVEVKYLPEDPWLNQPLGRDGTPLTDGLLSWSCVLPFNIFGIIELFIITRNYFRCRAAAERQTAVQLHFWETKNSSRHMYVS
jgi:hypothetical protein